MVVKKRQCSPTLDPTLRTLAIFKKKFLATIQAAYSGQIIGQD